MITAINRTHEISVEPRPNYGVLAVREALRRLTQADPAPATAAGARLAPGARVNRFSRFPRPQNWARPPSRPGYGLLMSTLRGLSHSLEATDRYMTGHSMRVSAFARAIGHEMQLDDETVQQIGFASELHDIGRTGIPQNLLHKTSVLTDEEYRLVMRHTIVGEEMVRPLPLKDPMMGQVVRWHHERFDGTGSPDGLSGKNIPLAVRIVSVSDAFDAMTSDRPFRPAMPIGLARYELQKQAGTSFDPACVNALETILSRTRPGTFMPDKDPFLSGRQLCAA